MEAKFNIGEKVLVELYIGFDNNYMIGQRIRTNGVVQKINKIYSIYGKLLYTYNVQLLDTYCNEVVDIREENLIKRMGFNYKPIIHYESYQSHEPTYKTVGKNLFEQTNIGGLGVNYLMTKPKRIISKPKDKITIILWDDNTKTISKCADGDQFNQEQGIMNCVTKKIFGGRKEYKRFLGYDNKDNNSILFVDYGFKHKVGDVIKTDTDEIGVINHIYFDDDDGVIYVIKMDNDNGHNGLISYPSTKLISGEEKDLGDSGWFVDEKDIDGSGNVVDEDWIDEV